MEEAKDEDCNLELETEEKTAHADQTEISDSVELPDCSDQHFTQALNILIHKPHAVHKRLAGSVILSGETDYARNFVLRRKLVLKKGSLHLFDTVIFKCGHNGTGSQCLEVSFVPEKHLPFMPSGFSVTKCGDKICFALDDAVPAPVRSKQNARKCFSTLIKWCSEETLSQSSPTLRLVSLEEYYKRYGLLKAKYGKSIIEVRNLKDDYAGIVMDARLSLAFYLELDRVYGCGEVRPRRRGHRHLPLVAVGRRGQAEEREEANVSRPWLWKRTPGAHPNRRGIQRDWAGHQKAEDLGYLPNDCGFKGKFHLSQ